MPRGYTTHLLVSIEISEWFIFHFTDDDQMFVGSESDVGVI